MPVNSCGFWWRGKKACWCLDVYVVIWIVNACIFLTIDDGYNFRRSQRSIDEAYSTTFLLQMERNPLIFSHSPEKLYFNTGMFYLWSVARFIICLQTRRLTRITFYIQYWKYFECIYNIVQGSEYLLWMIWVSVLLYFAKSTDFMQ